MPATVTRCLICDSACLCAVTLLRFIFMLRCFLGMAFVSGGGGIGGVGSNLPAVVPSPAVPGNMSSASSLRVQVYVSPSIVSALRVRVVLICFLQRRCIL